MQLEITTPYTDMCGSTQYHDTTAFPICGQYGFITPDTTNQYMAMFETKAPLSAESLGIFGPNGTSVLEATTFPSQSFDRTANVPFAVSCTLDNEPLANSSQLVNVIKMTLNAKLGGMDSSFKDSFYTTFNKFCGTANDNGSTIHLSTAAITAIAVVTSVVGVLCVIGCVAVAIKSCMGSSSSALSGGGFKNPDLGYALGAKTNPYNNH